MKMDLTHDELLDYWFSEDMSRHWFNSTAEIDADITDRFELAWALAREGKLDSWASSATGCLALIILLDQLPLNMFRGQEKSFSTEAKAIYTARMAIQVGFDKDIPDSQLMFMVLPFMHSENLEDQDFAVQLFESAGLHENHKFALHHRSIVQRFGRFPHRNDILGRESSQAEIDYLKSDEAFRG